MKHYLFFGALTGVVATFVIAPADKLMSRAIPKDQKTRERNLREGSPHDVAGKRIGASLLGRHLSAREGKIAQTAFSVVYGLAWGAVFAKIRKTNSRLTSGLGIPYGIGYFFACDGTLAPLAGMSPSIHRIPWAFNLKEAMNHVFWTVTVEAAHRVIAPSHQPALAPPSMRSSVPVTQRASSLAR